MIDEDDITEYTDEDLKKALQELKEIEREVMIDWDTKH